MHDLHVWTVTSGMVAMSGHAVVPDLESHPGVLDGIRAEMCRLGIGHVTIQLEVADGCEELVALAMAERPRSTDGTPAIATDAGHGGTALSGSGASHSLAPDLTWHRPVGGHLPA